MRITFSKVAIDIIAPFFFFVGKPRVLLRHMDVKTEAYYYAY